MASVSKTFSAVDQVSSTLSLPPGMPATLVITGTFSATLLLESSINNGVSWSIAASYTAAQASTPLPVQPATAPGNIIYRVRCSVYAAGSPVVTLADGTMVLAVVKGPGEKVALEVDSDGLASPILKTPSATGVPVGSVAYDPGLIAVNTLRVASDVVEGETVTIGTDVYEVEIVNTDSTDTALNGDFNNTTNPLTLPTFTTDYPEVTVCALGNLIKLGTEILRVILVNGTSRTFARGASGTTNAAHVNTTAIKMGDGIVAGIAVGLVTTLTPTAFTAALLADINAVGTELVTAVLVSVNEILLKARSVGAITIATTETLAGANNGWGATAMYGGKAAGVRQFNFQSRVPKTLDVTLGTMKFQFDFTPTLVVVWAVVTATPGIALAWDGAIVIDAGLVTIDNTGAADWATTNTIYVYAQS